VVDSTNAASASWIAYSSNLTVNLGTTDGWHRVGVGLRGRLQTSQQTWHWLRLNLQQAGPQLFITNPVLSASLKSLVQVQGYTPEPLRSIYFDVSNSLGVLPHQRGFVKAQYYDTNCYAFTTNYFQCFDVLLAEGSNLVRLYATNLAGNWSVTNLVLGLDRASQTNQPVVQLLWPQDLMQLGGESFTMEGLVDDPSASVGVSVLDTNGAPTQIYGFVERYGRFWVENVPLNPGTNTVSLWVADAWSNTVTMDLTLIRSGVGLTLSPITSAQVYGPPITVSGTISAPGYAVWVNGQPANCAGNGAWSAPNVPVGTGTTAEFHVTAAPTGGGESPPNPADPAAVSACLYVDKPDQIYVSGEVQHQSEHYSSSVGGDNWQTSDTVWDYNRSWTPGQGCSGTYLTTDSEAWTGWSFSTTCLDQMAWAPCWPPNLVGSTVTQSGDCGEATFPGEPLAIPNEHSDMYDPESGGDGNSSWTDDYSRNRETKRNLDTGRKPRPRRSAIFLVTGGANELSSIRTEADTMKAVDPKKVIVGSLGPAWSFDVLPEGETFAATPTVDGLQRYLHGAGETKFTPQIKFGDSSGWRDVTGQTTTNWVGQPVGLSLSLPPQPDYSLGVSNIQWTIPGRAIAGYTADTNSATVLTNLTVTNSAVYFYWIDDGTKQVTLSCMFGGQQISATTTFKVLRPEVTWTLTPEYYVFVGINVCGEQPSVTITSARA
jgi:hypothetical protein